MIKHYYAVDLESWVYPDLQEFKNLNQEERKQLDHGYIVDSTKRLLDLLEKYNTKLTFFVLGELYEWYPELIRSIKKAGHEIAYHTHTHVLLKNRTILEEQLELSKSFIDEFKPKGFQAPVIYFNSDSYELLRKSGFKYSSSVYHPDIQNKIIEGIEEIPVSTYRFRGTIAQKLNWPRPMGFNYMTQEAPFGSSYFTAIIGSYGTRYFIKKYEELGKSTVLFIHNWQIFPPKKAIHPNGSFLLKHPMYLPYTRNIKKDFESLLGTFDFGKLEDYRRGES